MKYQDGKLKREHHVLPDFELFLRDLAKLPLVLRLIPGRISRQQKGTSHCCVTVSYETQSGLKCNLKKGATVQELYVVCDQQNVPAVMMWIKTYIL